MTPNTTTTTNTSTVILHSHPTPKLSYAFFGTTNYSKELLLFLIENNLTPKVIFSIPKEFSISYSEKKVKNTNYADLKTIADKHSIPYYEIDSVKGKKTKDYENIIKELNLDLILVLGWYYMVPESTRELTKYGAWGIHASLLPKYAGGAPLNWAIINGEKQTEVTLFRMEDGVDDGDIIAQKAFSIEYEDTMKEAYDEATIASKQILAEVLNNIKNVKFTPQDKSKIEINPQRSPKDGMIDWHQDAKNIYDFIKAQTLPYTCAYSTINGNTIKIINATITQNTTTTTNTNTVFLHSHSTLTLSHKASPNIECGKITTINNQTVVAAKDNFIHIGLISDGEKQYRFEDYARAKNLWGGYSRAKGLRLAA